MVNHKLFTLQRACHGLEWRYEHKRWNVIYPVLCRILTITDNRICFICWNATNFNCNSKAVAIPICRKRGTSSRQYCYV